MASSMRFMALALVLLAIAATGADARSLSSSGRALRQDETVLGYCESQNLTIFAALARAVDGDVLAAVTSNTALTFFIPTDEAFMRFLEMKDLTVNDITDASFLDTLKVVLLNHVVPSAYPLSQAFANMSMTYNGTNGTVMSVLALETASGTNASIGVSMEASTAEEAYANSTLRAFDNSCQYGVVEPRDVMVGLAYVNVIDTVLFGTDATTLLDAIEPSFSVTLDLIDAMLNSSDINMEDPSANDVSMVSYLLTSEDAANVTFLAPSNYAWEDYAFSSGLYEDDWKMDIPMLAKVLLAHMITEQSFFPVPYMGTPVAIMEGATYGSYSAGADFTADTNLMAGSGTVRFTYLPFSDLNTCSATGAAAVIGVDSLAVPVPEPPSPPPAPPPDGVLRLPPPPPPTVNWTPPDEMLPTVQEVLGAGDFSQLRLLLAISGLSDTVYGLSNATIFAPTNEAVERASQAISDAGDSLDEDSAANVLVVHVVPEPYPENLLGGEELLPTLGGAQLTVSFDFAGIPSIKVTVEGRSSSAKLVGEQIKCADDVYISVIDTVLVDGPTPFPGPDSK